MAIALNNVTLTPELVTETSNHLVFLYVKNCHGSRDFSFLQETN